MHGTVISGLKLPVRRAGAVVISLLLASCGPAHDDRNSAVARSDRQSASATALNDKAILTRRGWVTSALLFAPPDSHDSVTADEAKATPAALPTLGPFRLGMTVDEARSAARRAHAESNGTFASNGDNEKAWCAPPLQPGGSGLILAPKELDFTAAGASDVRTVYQLRFKPVHSRLRLASVYVSDARRADATSNLLQRFGSSADSRIVRSCELTSAEETLVTRWDDLEDSSLIDTLGYPNLGKDQAPAVVRAALAHWERSVTIPCDGSADCPAITPTFDGTWERRGSYFVEYTLVINGFGAHFTPYLLVIGPGGNILWNGARAEFERRGMRRRAADAEGVRKYRIIRRRFRDARECPKGEPPPICECRYWRMAAVRRMSAMGRKQPFAGASRRTSALGGKRTFLLRLHRCSV
jgi:hypothetical protein